MLFMTIKQQTKIPIITASDTALTASPKMRGVGKPLVLPEPKIRITMMATTDAAASRSSVAKSILREIICSTKSSYFESL